MSGGDASMDAMRFVRDALETVVEPTAAAKVIFEALDEPDAGEVPQDEEGAGAFVHGPLARTLARRLGASVAARALEVIEDALSGSIDVEIEVQDAEAFFDPDLETRAVPEAGGPASVAVVARDDRLVRRLRVAFGPDRIAAVSVDAMDQLRAMVGSLAPEVVVIDGQNAADISQVELADGLAAGQETPLIVIWCADQPWGSAVSRALDERGVAHADVPRSEGVDPMLDYLRSRVGSTTLGSAPGEPR